MRNILKYIVIFVSIIISFIILLVIMACIPRSKIYKNVKETKDVLCEEGNRYNKRLMTKDITFDNYTDAIMVNNAYSMDAENPLYSALVIRRNYTPGVTKYVIKDEIGDPEKFTNETNNLECTLEEIPIPTKEYAKYWHGYLIFLKPLLLFINYSQIRILQLLLIIILSMIFLYLVYKNIGVEETIIFLLGLIIVDVECIYRTLEYTVIFILMFISSIFFIKKYKKMKDINIFFFTIGMLTCFLDFLTVPYITLGMPTLLYFLIEQKERNIKFKEMIVTILKFSMFWIFGYSLTWISKFIIVDLLYNKNLIHIAFKQVKHRTLNSTNKFELGIIESIWKNIKNTNAWIFVVFIVLQILGEIYEKIKKNNRSQLKENNKILNKIQVLPYIIISLMPLAWYMVLQEHSIRHAIFTYRGLMITYIGLMLAINKSLGEKEK